MPILDLVTILSLGLMIGNELAVSLFINPSLWKLEPGPQAQAVSLLARSLGAFMPFWYMLCFALLIAETYMRRHTPHIDWLYAAVVLWALTVVYTVTLLVPINNRIARMNSGSAFPEWQSKHVQWDRLHRWRIVMLVIAMSCFVWNVVSRA